jgi:hypothetical protein
MWKVGDRIKSIGYPVEPTGTVIEADSEQYRVKWDDGEIASFCQNPLPQTGRAEHFCFGRHIKADT